MKAPAPILRWSDGSAVKVGQRVVCERMAPARGSWARYAGRSGTVETVNRRDREVGVLLGSTTAWFTVDELAPTTMLTPALRPSEATSEVQAG